MSDTRIRARRATDVLREDHQKVKQLFSDYEAMKDGLEEDKYQLFIKIERELLIHAEIEEEVFYPAVEGQDAKIVAESREEHRVVKTLLEELGGLVPSYETFDAKMKVLGENVEHHAGEEEKEMFPLFDKLEADAREEVSERLAALKAERSREYPESTW
jgi:hemerythrin superfamily protein